MQFEPDDLKETDRNARVGRRERGDYEDVEDARKTASRDDDVVEEIADEDIVEISDLE